MTCICGLTYESFRTEMTYSEVRDTFWSADPDPETWHPKRRKSVLGRWHEFKLSMWDVHVKQCEWNAELEIEAMVKDITVNRAVEPGELITQDNIDTRQCKACSKVFSDYAEHARHIMAEHQLVVLEVVNIDLGRAVHHLACINTEQHIEKTVRGMLINMDRDRFFVREFDHEAYNS